MPQLFMDLGEGARAVAFISTFRWQYAVDVPQQLYDTPTRWRVCFTLFTLLIFSFFKNPLLPVTQLAELKESEAGDH
ncbi:hypothetical protein L6452_32697 [Arctium lappa]|uniref:Uncharacterized protein n=1 Tax=Arctium lappa TaxID=4217 RepID=A0ACB8Z4D8_ARCLA|nr:hypothetical protein L6452_32697 [Arctium lappa]